jgi:predicted HicB family RNase H-like nuclease
MHPTETKSFTVRLPADLHTRAHAAYHAAAMSTGGPKSFNAWVVRAIKAASEEQDNPQMGRK